MVIRTDYLNLLMKHDFGITKLTFDQTLWLALFTTAPSPLASGTPVEATYTGYQRQPYIAELSGDGNIQNEFTINFPVNVGSSQSVVGWGVYDKQTGGTLRHTDSFTSNSIDNNERPSFAAGALDITGS